MRHLTIASTRLDEAGCEDEDDNEGDSEGGSTALVVIVSTVYATMTGADGNDDVDADRSSSGDIMPRHATHTPKGAFEFL